MSVEPDTPADAALKVLSAETWARLRACLTPLGNMIARRREEPTRYYLNRMACLFLGIPPPPKSERQLPSLEDFETGELIYELRRRVREERDKSAATALCERMPARRRVADARGGVA